MPDSSLPSNNDITVFAETNYRNQKARFGIKLDDRRRHLYVLGKTGMGKTNMLQNMTIGDIVAGRGVGVIDPHGEFVEALLDYIPRSRINDVIYVNPADLDWPVAFNVLEKVSPEHRHLVASGVVGVFKKIWADSWGPRLEYVLRNGILALMEYEGSTLLGIMRILIDKEFRKGVITRVKDPTVRTFWVEEYTKYPDRFQAEAVAPIQNKVGQFLSSPLIRNIVGQTTTAFNIRDVIDDGKILLMNLSKGRIGEDASALLGAMMVTKLQLAAMSRVDVPEEARRDFYLYVDEFQNFATESFANILSEARKYRLDLTLAHQYITQLPEEVRDAAFGNVGTLVSFRIGADDAEFLEREFAPEFAASDLVNLAKYSIYLKLMIDGVASKAFSAFTLAPYPKPKESFREKIIRASRERYSTRRDQVEERIMRWYGLLDRSPEDATAREGWRRRRSEATEDERDEGSGGEPRARMKPKETRQLFETVCAECGKKAFVPFQPDGLRPVYCDDCLAQIRAGALAPRPSPVKTGERKEKVALRARRSVDVEGLRQVLKETIAQDSAPSAKTGPGKPLKAGEVVKPS